MSYPEQATGYLGIVTTEKTGIADRNIFEVGKFEDVHRQELTVVRHAYLGTDVPHRGCPDDDTALKLPLQLLYATVNQRYETLAVGL